MFQKIAVASATACLLCAGSPARAGEPDTAFVPAMQVRWTFGGPMKAKTDLSLRLNYAADPRALTVPSIVEWTVNANGDDALRLNGVQLVAGNLFVTETGDAPNPDSAGSGAKVALIILGAGGATALAIGALGSAAAENNPAVSDNQPSVVCTENPVGNNCVVGGG